jgi:hypothetical protein
MPPINNQPNIEITLDGLQLVFVDSENKRCTVGVLADAPEGHDFTISVFKADAAGILQPFAQLDEADIKTDLEINVSDTSQTGISRRKMDVTIDRKAGPTFFNRDSFRWVVDFESELYQKPIGAKKAGFVSFLTIDKGELLARSLSHNELIIQRGPQGAPEVFGKVATQTGIDIVLDRSDSKAVFKNGNHEVFTADSTSIFQVNITRVCSNKPGGHDADAYYSAIGDLVPFDEKIFFSSTPLPPGPTPPNTPDASCLGGNMSQSRPGG